MSNIYQRLVQSIRIVEGPGITSKAYEKPVPEGVAVCKWDGVIRKAEAKNPTSREDSLELERNYLRILLTKMYNAVHEAKIEPDGWRDDAMIQDAIDEYHNYFARKEKHT